jgi:hypothetical protein
VDQTKPEELRGIWQIEPVTGKQLLKQRLTGTLLENSGPGENFRPA